jgi:hypothetical protein
MITYAYGREEKRMRERTGYHMEIAASILPSAKLFLIEFTPEAKDEINARTKEINRP